MTDDKKRPDDDASENISAHDHQALTDLFAALTADAPPSEVSPLRVVKLGQAEVRAGVDRRIRRFRILRNIAVAAAVATVVVLVGSRIGGTSSSTSTAASSDYVAAVASSTRSDLAAGVAPAGSSAAAAGSAAASAPASGGYRSDQESSRSNQSNGSAGAAAASSAPAGSPAAGGAAASSSSAASWGSASARPGSSAAAPTKTACPALPAKTIAAVRTAIAESSLRVEVVDGCETSSGQNSVPLSSGSAADVLVNLRRAPVASCAKVQPVTCRAVAGTSGAYRSVSGRVAVWVYGNGYEVYLTPARSDSAITVDRLVSAGRAVVKVMD
ncbi:hypothetical protein SAMN04515671_1007 [Nakamurella panacisegetis]|uniref:Uncharacterized protein n=1 Tax=Nakamurella panacisegetis TaxID=1090615 RepID=A0A1H0JRG0_9ACTN|nr:hypothetical protein [Nakamurella panacisegetis]SDO46119.1 hypothetical protein SAMN04515671_1007 [Nakamurella panacisegetis]